ncbi:MAG: L-rhamnose mutarotase [Hamadaea sp.]|uniref:L-rhamnose mutarotase n=1 Tax=Hamadaea sp. NPDC050747 TaxID=3155789 RepID=UPI00184B4585|nr:L-rhamnose mutarotase [Hamadaea sp.]NUR46990.1 L-rhamnose mutarotase [Hamadaea sp.]NUT08560.1 L-rhamnose mutarotase [Hamadaea sp.]
MKVALHTRIRPDRIADYEAAHQEVPPELVSAIRDSGAREWTIWRSGADLFHVIEVDDYAAMIDRLAGLPVNIAWQARMAELLDVAHDYSSDAAGAVLPVVWQL